MPAYLTIDDAPSPNLPEKLALLDEHGVPALFFCEGRRLAEYADFAREAVESGFHLGNHAYTHTHAAIQLPSAFRTEVRRTEERIDAVYDDAGVERPARVFRFPYGDRGRSNADRFQHVLGDIGFETPESGELAAFDADSSWADGRDWGWTLDVQDWAVDSTAELTTCIEERLGGRHPGESDVVLFHDAGTDIAYYEVLLEAFWNRGIEFGDPLDLLQD